MGKRSTLLIADAKKNLIGGIGNTEASKYNLSGWYSKRITQEHRMIYRVEVRYARNYFSKNSLRHLVEITDIILQCKI